MRVRPTKPSQRLSFPSRIVVIAQAQSSAGDALLEVGAFWFIVSHGGTALTLGAFAITIAVSGLAGGALGGPIVDRVARARLMARLDWCRAAILVAGFVGLIAQREATWVLFIVAATVSGGSAMYISASRALVASLEPHSTLLRVNSSLQAWTSAASIAGYGGAALVYPLGGIGLVVLLDAATFLLAGLLLQHLVPIDRIAVTPMAQGGGLHRFSREFTAGVRAATGEPIVRGLIIVSMLAVLLLAPLDPLGPVLVTDVLGASIGWLAVIETAVMTGRVSGSLLARRMPDRAPLPLLTGITAIMAFATATIPLIPSVLTVPVSYLTLGFCAGLSAVVMTTGIQMNLDSELLGRVFGLHRALLEAVPPIGIFALTAVADLAGPLAAFWSIATALGILTLIATALTRGTASPDHPRHAAAHADVPSS